MRTFFTRSAFTVISVLVLALPGFAGQLDDYYLTEFGAKPGSALEKALLSPVTEPVEAAHCGTPLKHGLSRDWNKLEPATQKVLAKQLAAPVLSGNLTTLTSSGGHFTIYYTTTGNDAPNINDYTINGFLYHGINYYTGLGLTSIADWAGKVGDAFEFAYTFYQNLGYHMPQAPYDVYLVSLAAVKEYGETTAVDTVKPAISGFPYAWSSEIQLDKDFTDGVFKPTVYTPLQSLQVTSAHEFHHAIQYGYNYYFDVWYAEATSTWFEDEVWPGVNQNYGYIPGWFNNSTRQVDLPQTDPGFNGQAYGRWIFNRYLAEKHTTTVVRSFWEKLAGIAPINGQDIPMVPLLDSVLSASYGSTLGADFLGFAKRVYTRDWTSHIAEISMIPPYSPVANYSSYPVNATSVTLPHDSFAYYKFIPTAAVPDLTITLEKTSGIQAAVFKKSGGVISEVAANAGGTSYTLSSFNTMDEATLLLVGITNFDGHQASFSTDGSTLAVLEPTVSTVAASNGGKSGCFIATAAYGSYLHPKVALLRAFRDDYLLTNPPGRLFVWLYYRVSPPIADLIARHDWLRGATRLLLAPVIFAVEHFFVALFLLCLGLAGLVVGIPRVERTARRGMI